MGLCKRERWGGFRINFYFINVSSTKYSIDTIIKLWIEEKINKLKVIEIEPNREQPRKIFDEEALEELANSIKEYGLCPIHRRSFTKKK